MRKITEIIVHCTATPQGRDVNVSDVDRWHKSRGFRCIGYHYLVGIDGRVECGRPITETGAHCLGHNANSIGVCYVGGLATDGKTPLDTRTDPQRGALVTLIAMLKRKHPGARVFGHRDFAAKACPCFDAAKEYSAL